MLPSLEISVSRSLLLSSCKLLKGSPQCCAQIQSVRNYPRKPRWLPIAKSKMYKIIEVAVPPKFEFEESVGQYAAYRLYNRSLWAYQSNISRERELQDQRDAKQVSEEVELERMFTFNDAENEKVRKVREAALIEEWKETEREILEIRKQKEEEELQKLEQTEEFVQAEMERLKGAIKEEDLDKAIEEALAVEFDYNYAISKDGKYFRGRFNATESVDGPPPNEPVVRPLEAKS